jgi:hypothetical protein
MRPPLAAPALETQAQLVEEEPGEVDNGRNRAAKTGTAWLGESGTTRSSAGGQDEQPERTTPSGTSTPFSPQSIFYSRSWPARGTRRSPGTAPGSSGGIVVVPRRSGASKYNLWLWKEVISTGNNVVVGSEMGFQHGERRRWREGR